MTEKKIIGDLVNRYLEDGHYENVKGIYRWDKMTPSFPTVLKKGRSGRTASIQWCSITTKS